MTAQRGRIVFQPAQSDPWWGGRDESGGTGYVGVLSQPKKRFEGFRYYVEVTDNSLGTTRGRDCPRQVLYKPQPNQSTQGSYMSFLLNHVCPVCAPLLLCHTSGPKPP